MEEEEEESIINFYYRICNFGEAKSSEKRHFLQLSLPSISEPMKNELLVKLGLNNLQKFYVVIFSFVSLESGLIYSQSKAEMLEMLV